MTWQLVSQMLTAAAPSIANHLWQSTVFTAVVWLLALALKKNHARARYWLWMSASVKFLLPFSLLTTAGEWLRSLIAAPVAAEPALANVMEQVAQPFSQTQFFDATSLPSPTHHSAWLPMALLAMWFCGALVVAIRFGRGLRRVWSAKRVARPLELAAGVRVLCSPALIEPGVFGISRPVLLLPEGILERLTPEQLKAIVAHELCHVRQHDNLTFSVHMIVETLFWFYPPVWWIGSRLIEERERACDEAVLQAGSEAEVYAEGILNVCKFYAESPLKCVAGVTGADLKQRIVRILSCHPTINMNLGRKLLLGAAAMVLVAGPVAEGLAGAFHLRAQLLFATGNPPSFEVATIKPSHSSSDLFNFRMTDTRFSAENASLTRLVRFAYNISSGNQLAKDPDWMNSERFDVDAKITDAQIEALKNLPPEQRLNQYRLMVQSLLADRFKMKVSTEVKELPVYALVVAKDGTKLTPASFQHIPWLTGEFSRGDLNASGVSMKFFTNDWLSRRPDLSGRAVIDATGLQGSYDFTLKWSPVDMSSGLPSASADRGAASATVDSSGPSLFTALQEQLGLKLEPRKAPVEVLVIDHVEKPSPN